MNRKKFLKKCTLGCLGLASSGIFFMGCSSVKYVNGPLSGAFISIPISAFEELKNKSITFRKSVVVENSALNYPIFIYRKSQAEFKASLMKCTHQGTELQVFGDRLQCPAHGSEFSSTGKVQNGPADTSLREFTVSIENSVLKINLS